MFSPPVLLPSCLPASEVGEDLHLGVVLADGDGHGRGRGARHGHDDGGRQLLRGPVRVRHGEGVARAACLYNGD